MNQNFIGGQISEILLAFVDFLLKQNFRIVVEIFQSR